jgi:hypothetical protein
MFTHIRHFHKTRQLTTAICALLLLLASITFAALSIPVIMQQNLLIMKVVATVVMGAEAVIVFMLARYECIKLSWKDR